MLNNEELFCNTAAWVKSIELKKKGLPHAHCIFRHTINTDV